jgi:hypothetical protein
MNGFIMAEAFTQRVADFFALFALVSLVIWGVVLCSMIIRIVIRQRYRETAEVSQKK